MANRYSNLAAEISDTILAALEADSLQKEVEAQHQKAINYLNNCQFSKAAATLGKMAMFIGQEGYPADEAAIRFAQARAYARLPNRAHKSLEACHAALALAEKVGNTLLRGEICLFMTRLEIAHENFLSAYLAVGQAITLFEKFDNQTAKLISCYHLQAGITAFLLMFDRSRKSFMVARALAKVVGDAPLAVEIQRHRTAATSFEKGVISADLLRHLFTATTKSGKREITSRLYLHSALEELKAKNYPIARKSAEMSLALGKADQSADGHIRYLLASLVLAEIYDAEENRVAVLKVLLRCKVYLEQNFKNTMGGNFVKHFLDSFHQRWGQTALKTTVEKYYLLAMSRQTMQR